MKFAFLIHPINEYTKALMHLNEAGMLREWGSGDPFRFCLGAQRIMKSQGFASDGSENGEVRLVDELVGLRSSTGRSVEGRIYEVPMQAREILDDPERAVTFMEQAVDQAAAWGAQIVGLGSMTGIVGNQGRHLAERGPIAATTGNSLTVFATLENLRHVCEETGIVLSEETVAIVGAPGSIASALARDLAPRCHELVLVARRMAPKAVQLADELGVPLLLDLREALNQASVILTATSSGNCLDVSWLRPGSVVLDVAVPTDVIPPEKPRDDVLVISAGLSSVPATMPRDSTFLGFYQGTVPSCLGETIVLALEDRAECFSVGRDLDLERIREIGALAVRHGFDFSQLMSFALPLEASQLAPVRKYLARHRRPQRKEIGAQPNNVGKTEGPCGGNGARKANGRIHLPGKSGTFPQVDHLAGRARKLVERHINPVLAALGGPDGLTRTFVRGAAAEVYDETGRSYLDFVSGYGSLNLGHNHPEVVRAVKAALEQEAPGFAQSSINPLAAALAEQLVALTPPGLEMVFFTNSGAESVEAAIKLARIATGRPGLVACEGGFHGKTLGALSLTANIQYRQPFQPLVPETSFVPYGDLEALERTLASRQAAGFIVEPIQGEGGMIVPPEGYLVEAQGLCRRYGTLFIVDEIQTGLGRTGNLFAVDHEGVEPDVLTLAKSLGGGLMPLGAMLTRRDLWLRAYGTFQTFALHSSTFGGGSLAYAAGLATLRVLRAHDLAGNARDRGEQLRAGLEDLVERSSLLQSVRGRGLMMGLEFRPLPAAVAKHGKGMAGSPLAPFLVPKIDDLMGALPAIYAMSSLLHEHGIYTQVARSNPLVLRVQPPLIVSAAQADRFLVAISTAVSDFDLLVRVADSVLSRSIGDHQAVR